MALADHVIVNQKLEKTIADMLGVISDARRNR
jgi:hypothetical protein